MPDKFFIGFVENFVSREEREYLVALINERARYLETPPDLKWSKPPRRCDMREFGDQTVFRVEARLAQTFRVPRQFGEGLQGQLYEAGEYYSAHYDAFHKGTAEFERQMPVAGQRSYSALIYLEAARAGGQTHFPQLGVEIEPSLGLAVFWSNLDDSGRPHRLSMHESAPVIVGRKIVITSWYRERTYAR